MKPGAKKWGIYNEADETAKHGIYAGVLNLTGCTDVLNDEV